MNQTAGLTAGSESWLRRGESLSSGQEAAENGRATILVEIVNLQPFSPRQGSTLPPGGPAENHHDWWYKDYNEDEGRAATAFVAAGTGYWPEATNKGALWMPPKAEVCWWGLNEESAHNIRYSFPWNDQNSCFWILFKMIRKWSSPGFGVIWVSSNLGKVTFGKSVLNQWETFQLLGDYLVFYFWTP